MAQSQLPENYVSILQCVETFKLNRSTPEQIVDQIFSSQKTQPMPKDQFLSHFKTTFDRNVTPDYIEYIDGAAARVFFVCAQDANEITVDQLGKGISAFTSRQEKSNILQDMFYYLNYTYKSIIQEEDIQEFLKEVSAASVSKVTSFMEEFKKSLMKDKGNTDMSYWTLYIWRSHPVVKGLVEIYKEIHNIQQQPEGFRLSTTESVLHKSGYIQDFRTSIPEINGKNNLSQPSPGYYAFDQTSSTLGSTLGATIQVERGANNLSTSRTFFGHEQEAKYHY